MDYLEFKITCLEEFREILIAELAEIGFDSFLETEEGIDAYAPEVDFDRGRFEEIRILGVRRKELGGRRTTQTSHVRAQKSDLRNVVAE